MSRTRDVVTGLFVIGGIGLLALLIVWFEGVASVLRGGYTVETHLPGSMGIRKGKPVELDGIAIGQVTSVRSSLPEKPGVWVVMQIAPDERIPKTARLLACQSAMGSTSLDFVSTEPPTAGYLPTDGSAKVSGIPQPYRFLPEDLATSVGEFAEDLRGLRQLIENLTELTAPRTPAEVQAGKPGNLSSTLDQISATASSIRNLTEQADIHTLLAKAETGAEELSQTLVAARQTLAQIEKTFHDVGTDAGDAVDSLRETSDAWRQTARQADLMLQQIKADADHANRVLENIEAITADLRQGKGAVGKVLTDPQLYNVLVTLLENLNALSSDARHLVTFWRKEGLLAKQKE